MKLVVIAGETASGKTACALELARRIDGELVGADSVQVYRGFDVGSAKPTAEALGGVRHPVIDGVEPDEGIDAMGYAALADAAIADVRARGKVPIVVGGTGLWLRALLRGLVDLPKPDPEVRARLEAEAKTLGAPALHARLAGIDPDAARAIHPNDQLRIVRALEVFEQTGEPLGALRKAHALGAPRYDAVQFVLTVPRDVLYARIDLRTHAMLDAGFADEVRRLVERYGRDVRALGAVGYREMLAHVLDGEAIEETEQRIVHATRVYARRQRTWFGGEPGFDARVTAEELLDGRIERALHLGD